MDTLRIQTERTGVELRQLATEADDTAYFAAIDANRDHTLSQLGDETAAKYPDLASVRATRLNPANRDKLRLGIWDGEVFAGSINLTPDQYGSAEIGYWLDARHTGNGYATIATKALARYGARKYYLVYANVTDGNEASVAVLERAGFQMLAKEVGSTVFGLNGIKAPSSTKPTPRTAETVTATQAFEQFAELPSRRDALRAKDKDNLTVFLSLGVAKKLYRCQSCSGAIEIGSIHVIMSRVQMSKRFNHHHLDFDCVQEKVLPRLSNIQIIKPEETSATAVNARSRRYRSKNRRRGR